MRRLVLAGLAGLLLPWTPGLERLERIGYDVRLQLANRFFPGRLTMDPRVVVIGVEPESYREIEQHPVFWLPHYTSVAKHALDCGAARVALDILPSYADPKAIDEFAPLASSGKLTMIAYWDAQENSVQAPPAPLVLPLGVQNLALANLSLDGDGVARRQQVGPIRISSLYGRNDWNFLASALCPTDLQECEINYTLAQPTRFAFHRFLRESPNLEGKIVLIGSRARVDQDLVFSPLGGSIFGVDYQAQVLNTLLQNRPLRTLPAGPWLALCLIWIAGGRRLRALVASHVLLWCTVSLGLLIWTDRILPVAPALLGIPLAGALTAVQRWHSERTQRLRLLQLMSGYVAPEILAEMLAEPESWIRSLNQRREVTLLFSDINGFSSACEQHPPEQIAAWLDRYYQEMTAIVFAHQGTIIRFVGDQFMVLFGSPKPVSEPEARAVRAALAMQSRLKALEASGQEGFHRIKIGIHCGSMLLAVLGNQSKREYTAIGDEANVAARIQDLCKQLDQPILVSQAVQCRLKEQFTFKSLGEHEVKGRQQSVPVFSVEA
ncbi:adenylate/guanylate cyclase domain-containing protein [bacterium]|nr:adenylate/guanylate cyclase domain-containing protein [bacterium]